MQPGASRSLTFPDAGVKQDAPGEPHGGGQGQRVLLLLLAVHLEPAEGAAGCRGQAGEGAAEGAGELARPSGQSPRPLRQVSGRGSPEAVQQVQHHGHHVH